MKPKGFDTLSETGWYKRRDTVVWKSVITSWENKPKKIEKIKKRTQLKREEFSLQLTAYNFYISQVIGQEGKKYLQQVNFCWNFCWNVQ